MSGKTAAAPLSIQVFNVRIFLLATRTGWILVDAGIPLLERRITRAIRSRGIDPSQIETIILTHGHLDHIGCLAYLQELSGASVICHRSLAPLLAAGCYEEAVPRVPAWQALNGPLHKVLAEGLRPVPVGITFKDTLDLDPFGLEGQLIHTPGHSPGSASLLLASGECLLGDLLREPAPGTYDTGLFYHSRDQILDSLARICRAQPQTIHLSHGTTMSCAALEDFLLQNCRLAG